jgi:hypothetical protein
MMRFVRTREGLPMLAKIVVALAVLTLTLVALRKVAAFNQGARVKARSDRRPVDKTRNAVALREDPRTGVWRED